MLLGSGEDLQEGEEYDDVDLPALLQENKEKEVELLVWNIKSQQERLVTLVPSDSWPGQGLLGVTIRLDNYAGAEDRIIRVLEVEENSPAAIAGLVPFKDFLLGTTHQTLETTSVLSHILRENKDTVVEFYVYNTDSDLVRTVALMPTLSWGQGKGLLGAQVGVGYLHRLPYKVRNTEGASITRRVVKYRPQKNHSTNEDNDPHANGAVVELEPQLEMEETDDENESSTGASPSVVTVPLDVAQEDEDAYQHRTNASNVFSTKPPP